MAYENPSFVARRYGDASKVDARILPHRRFSTNPLPWQGWVFDNLDRPEEARLLDAPGSIRITKDTGVFVARK